MFGRHDRAGAHARPPRTWLLAVMLIGGACSSAKSPPPAPHRADAEASSTWNDQLADPDVATVLAATAQPHAAARVSLGPHRLHYTASFTQEPTTANDGLPAVDGFVVEPVHVSDELTLQFAGVDARGPRFSLTQANDHDRGRDIVIADGRVYSRLRPRPWTFTLLQAELYELWLNDAQRAPHDALALAAPALAVNSESRPGAGLDGRDAVAVHLALADHVDPTQLPDTPGQKWRSQIEISAVEGEIVLDRETGLWLEAAIAVEYAFRGADGRNLRGGVKLGGRVEPLEPAAAEISPPPDASPGPERTRYTTERRELLEGLAAP